MQGVRIGWDQDVEDAGDQDVRMAPGRSVTGGMASGRNALPTLPLELRLTSGASQASDAQDARDAKNNFC